MEKLCDIKEALVDLLFEEFKIDTFKKNMEDIGTPLPSLLSVFNITPVLNIIGFPKTINDESYSEDDYDLLIEEIHEQYFNKTDKLVNKYNINLNIEDTIIQNKIEIEIKKDLLQIVDWLYIEYEKFTKLRNLSK